MTEEYKGPDPDLATFTIDTFKFEAAVNRMLPSNELKDLILRGRWSEFYEHAVKAVFTDFRSWLYGADRKRIKFSSTTYASWWDHTKSRFPWIRKILWKAAPPQEKVTEVDEWAFGAVCPHITGPAGVKDQECVEWLVRATSEDEKDNLIADLECKVRDLESGVKHYKSQVEGGK